MSLTIAHRRFWMLNLHKILSPENGLFNCFIFQNCYRRNSNGICLYTQVPDIQQRWLSKMFAKLGFLRTLGMGKISPPKKMKEILASMIFRMTLSSFCFNHFKKIIIEFVAIAFWKLFSKVTWVSGKCKGKALCCVMNFLVL